MFIGKIPHHSTVMIQLGSRLFFLRPAQLLGAIAVAASLLLSSCASMGYVKKPDGTWEYVGSEDSYPDPYEISASGQISTGGTFKPSSGSISTDSNGVSYYRYGEGRVINSYGQRCEVKEGYLSSKVVCK